MKIMTEHTRLIVRPCPLCGSRVGRPHGSLSFQVCDETPVAGDFTVVVCAGCGFAFSDTPSIQADFNRYYQENAYYGSAATIGSGGSSPHEMRRFESLAHRLAPHIPGPDAVVFDVGCARGGLLEVLARRGFSHLYGVDMLPACVLRIKNRLGLAAEVGNAFNLPFPDVRADVLIYSHVIEHVVDLVALVAAAREKLSDAGIIYVEVPDASQYGECSTHPFEDFYLEHVNHMDITALMSLFQSGGFSTVVTGSFLLEAPPRSSVPCIWGIFRLKDAPHMIIDRELELHLSDYLAWSERHPAFDRFTELADAQIPLCVWGISQYALLLLGQTSLRRCNLRRFVDADPNKRQRKLMGRPIDPPEVLQGVAPDHAVIVTALGYEDAIVEALDGMGFRGKILTSLGETIT